MEKYKREEVSPVEEENERNETYQASNPQIDSSLTHLNYHIIYPMKSYMEIINGRLSELELKRKIRSDAILMNSVIVMSDGEFFKGLHPWEQREFFQGLRRVLLSQIRGRKYDFRSHTYGRNHAAYASQFYSH